MTCLRLEEKRNRNECASQRQADSLRLEEASGRINVNLPLPPSTLELSASSTRPRETSHPLTDMFGPFRSSQPLLGGLLWYVNVTTTRPCPRNTHSQSGKFHGVFPALKKHVNEPGYDTSIKLLRYWTMHCKSKD